MCKELLRLKTNELFTLDYNVRRIRGYSSVHTGLLRVFFSNRVINRWNKLDQQAVGASSVNAFNGSLSIPG